MRSKGLSVTFTVHFDGQFWVGTIERMDGGELSASRVVFGAEPPDEEVLRFVIERWNKLRFSPGIEAQRKREPRNPKRRQRKAAKEAAGAVPSTKAQQALAAMREQDKETARKRGAASKQADEERRRTQHKEKRREKHRGH